MRIDNTPESPQIISIYCCCDDRDKKFSGELDSHCAELKRSGRIRISYNQEILPGSPKADLINSYINAADIILLLISKDFYSSDLCIEVMERALEQYKKGEIWIIPILLSPYLYQETPIAKLQWLPQGRSGVKAVTRWTNRQEAYVNIVEGLSNVVLSLRNQRPGKEEWRLTGYARDIDVIKEMIGEPVFDECQQALYMCEQAIHSDSCHPFLYQEKAAIILKLKRYGELKENICLEPDSIHILKEMNLVVEDLAVRVSRLLRYLASYTDEIGRQSQDGTE